MNQTIKNILDKPMDRKDFLKHIGVGALFVAGGGMILNAVKLQELSSQKPQLADKSSYGYGASAYGGSKNSV